MIKQVQADELFDVDFFVKWVPFLLNLDISELYKTYIEIVEKTFKQASEPKFLYNDLLDENVTLGTNDYPLSFYHYKEIRERGFYFSEILFEEIKLKEEIQQTIKFLSEIYSQNYTKNLLHNIILKQVKILLSNKSMDEMLKKQYFSDNLQIYRYHFWLSLLETIRNSLILIRKNFVSDTNAIINFYLQYDIIFQSLKNEQLKKEIREEKTEVLLDKFVHNIYGNFKGWTQEELDLISQLKHYYDFCLDAFIKYKKYFKSGRSDLLIELANELQESDISLFEYISSENNQKEILSELPSSTALLFVYNTAKPWVKEKYKKNPRSLRNAFTELDTNEKEKYFIEQIKLFEKRIKEYSDPKHRNIILNGLEYLKDFVPPERVELFKNLQVGVEEDKSHEELKEIFDSLKSNIHLYSYNKRYNLLREIRLLFLLNPEQKISIEEQQKNILLFTEKLKNLL